MLGAKNLFSTFRRIASPEPTPTTPHFHRTPTGWGTNETFSGSKDILRVVRSSPHSSSVDSNFGTIRFFHAASFFPCGKLSQHCWVLTRNWAYCVMIRHHVFLAGIFISWFLGQSAFIFGEVTSPLWHQRLCHIDIPRPSQYTFTLYLESWPQPVYAGTRQDLRCTFHQRQQNQWWATIKCWQQEIQCIIATCLSVFCSKMRLASFSVSYPC